MLLSLVRVGNSLGVRLPRRALSPLGLGEGDRLFLSAEGERLILSKRVDHPKVRAFMEAVRPMLGKTILLIYAFGSFTTPRFRPEKSDIDLYVVVRDRRDVMPVYQAASRVDSEDGFRSPPLGPVVVPRRDVDWGWFQHEVAPGLPLFIHHESFPNRPPEGPILARPGGAIPGRSHGGGPLP